MRGEGIVRVTVSVERDRRVEAGEIDTVAVLVHVLPPHRHLAVVPGVVELRHL